MISKPSPAGKHSICFPPWRWIQFLAFALCTLGLMPFAHGQTPAAGLTNSPVRETYALPPSVPDPLEPFNRVMWAFNVDVLTDVIKPTSRGYRFIICKPVRTSIGNFAYNLLYPGRLINNLLEEKWLGSRDETYRFLCNSTLGVAGFFDVATRWKIPKSDKDFGETFGQWGWKPHCFLMLPFLGPSNERDALGLAADTAANPLLYITPYDFVVENPWTWLGPYSYFSIFASYNNLSGTVDESVRFAQAEMDPYSEVQYAWTFARENRVANFQVQGKQDPASLETLQSVFFTYQDPEFPNRAKTRSVSIPATGRKLKFTFWLQPGKANVVYIIPGLGSSRLAENSLALAELVYKNGFSAVCISSPFNSEFMENAATAQLPGYLPVDGHDLHVALTAIDHHLHALYPDRLGNRALMGYSMGAIETMYLAAQEPTNHQPLIKFDRYLAINTPVELAHGISMLDEFYRAPLQWPVAERTNDINNTFLKVAALSKLTLTPRTTLPFNAIESKFLIGLTYRFMLRDIIYSSQRRHNQGVLQHPIREYRRAPLYKEIMNYSYQDYFSKFAVPYYKTQDLAAPVAKTLAQAGDLRTYTTALRTNPDIRIIDNENDFLLTDPDLAWLRATFPPSELTIFNRGGHLGNLSNPTVQKSILAALTPMRPPDPIPEKPVKDTGQ